MSKRQDLDWAYSLSPETMQRLAMAWELGRVAGIREAAGMASYKSAYIGLPANSRDLYAHARKLKRRLK